MRFTIRPLAIVLLFAAAWQPCHAERLTPEKLWDLARIGDAAVSPDGTQLAYLVTRYDLKENKGTVSLLLQPLGTDAQQSTQQTAVAFGTSLAAPAAKVLLRDIEGLGSLGWLDHASGPKLVYIAPAPPADSEDDAEREAEEKETD